MAQSEKAEQPARICELARRLGYNDAKTKILVGQSAGNLAALERKLLNELDERPARASTRKSNNGRGPQPEQESAPANQVTPAVQPGSASAERAMPGDGGFLF